MNENSNLAKPSSPTGARAIVYRDVDNKRQYLITTGLSGKKSLVGGGMEVGDADSNDTIVREIEEEIGLRPGSYEIIKTAVQCHFVYGSHKQERAGQEAIDDIFLVKLGPDTELMKTNELQGFAWLSYNQAKESIEFEEIKNIFVKIVEENLN